MEKNFYTDDFEHFLKDSTDNYRMYPSKRVWHSIYNDLHPSRKWPSLAVCLVLISAILFIGISNNNAINSSARKVLAENLLAAHNQAGLLNSQPSLSRGWKDPGQGPKTAGQTPVSDLETVSIPPMPGSDNRNSTIASQIQQQDGITNPMAYSPGLNASTQEQISNNQQSLASPNATGNPGINNTRFTENKPAITTSPLTGNIAAITQLPGTIQDQTSGSVNDKEAPANINKMASPKKATIAETTEKAWIENYAFHNKPLLKKWKNRSSFQFYVTPSVGFRSLRKNSDYELNAQALLAPNTISVQNVNDMVTQSAALNMEAGAAVIYNLTRKWRLKTGLQVNYTNYVISAYELNHPTQTTLLLNDLNTGFINLVSRNTTLANSATENYKKLNNNTLQLSLPIGIDLKLAGSNRLKWYAGASIQPTYISSGNMYAISFDAKNYVEDPSLLRQWNLNAGLESFISYETNSGIILNAGPQLRYQFLSTYSKEYSYTEKLYNLGLKLGMTRKF